VITKFNIPRVSPSAKRTKASTQIVLLDRFEIDAVHRQRQLDDWQDPQPDESGFRFLDNPNDADNDLRPDEGHEISPTQRSVQSKRNKFTKCFVQITSFMFRVITNVVAVNFTRELSRPPALRRGEKVKSLTTYTLERSR